MKRLWLEIKTYSDLQLAVIAAAGGAYMMMRYTVRGDWLEVVHSSTFLLLAWCAWRKYRQLKRFMVIAVAWLRDEHPDPNSPPFQPDWRV